MPEEFDIKESDKIMQEKYDEDENNEEDPGQEQ